MQYPGLVDLQINGHRGVHFSASNLTLDQIRQATLELAAAGTVAYCPTIVTSPLENFQRNLALFAQAMRDPEISPHILGLHIEGPFISPLEGARGAHPPEHIRKPDIKLFQQLQEWSGNNIAILTVAPEVPGAIELIRHVSAAGVVVSMGHHLAEDEAMEAAVRAGATACTHLGNGLPNNIKRHQNPLWWLMACDDVWGMCITDGQHLPEDFIRVALRAKTLNKFAVVSDATDLAGMPPGNYQFQGHDVVLEPNGRIGFAGTPYLAGSSATMLQCMNNLAALNVLSEAELWQVGFDNPLKLLGRDPKAVAAKLPERKVQFKNGRFEVIGK
ncbi:MAG: N-acetylglucosamine-6-phosphate deacetylase [Kiritimatiellia bacterium]|jgi:N-acetylglucosamine-6-phosphate deacetylase